MMQPLRTAILAAGVLASTGALAQQSGGYFMPPAAAPAAQPPSRPAAQPQRAPQPRPIQRPDTGPTVRNLPPDQGLNPNVAGAGQPEAPPVQVALPPMQPLPAIPRGPTPPAAVIGVLGIPDIMRASTAAQQVDKAIGERREKLTQDVAKEQAAWREMQQTLANGRSGMTPDQIRAKEKELQDRVTNAQRTFRDRNRFMQEAAQVGLAQIERTLIAVIRQVAESRGMNLVMHRSQVALNVNEFDITEGVVEQLNKVLPAVQLPPDGVSAAVASAPAAGANSPPDAPAPAVPTQVVAPPGPPPRR